MATVDLIDLENTYGGGFRAVHGINLSGADGEFMVLVGPSGCAKSMTLHRVAGLEEITGGEVWIGGKAVNHLTPGQRSSAMVFQNRALYPHMRVRSNLAFGLRLAGVPRAERNRAADEVAAILEIEPLLDRLPKQLAGRRKGSPWAGRRSRCRVSSCSTNRCRTSIPSCGHRCLCGSRNCTSG